MSEIPSSPGVQAGKTVPAFPESVVKRYKPEELVPARNETIADMLQFINRLHKQMAPKDEVLRKLCASTFKVVLSNVVSIQVTNLQRVPRDDEPVPAEFGYFNGGYVSRKDLPLAMFERHERAFRDVDLSGQTVRIAPYDWLQTHWAYPAPGEKPPEEALGELILYRLVETTAPIDDNQLHLSGRIMERARAEDMTGLTVASEAQAQILLHEIRTGLPIYSAG